MAYLSKWKLLGGQRIPRRGPTVQRGIGETTKASRFFVCLSNNSHNSIFERIANPLKCRHCNRTTSLDLLPMASGESEGSRTLLDVATPLAEFLHSLANSFEEFGVIYHDAGTFTFS